MGRTDSNGDILSWQGVAPMAGGSEFQGCLQVGNVIYMIGGLTGSVRTLITDSGGNVQRFNFKP